MANNTERERERCVLQIHTMPKQCIFIGHFTNVGRTNLVKNRERDKAELCMHYRSYVLFPWYFFLLLLARFMHLPKPRHFCRYFYFPVYTRTLGLNIKCTLTLFCCGSLSTRVCALHSMMYIGSNSGCFFVTRPQSEFSVSSVCATLHYFRMNIYRFDLPF